MYNNNIIINMNNTEKNNILGQWKEFNKVLRKIYYIVIIV